MLLRDSAPRLRKQEGYRNPQQFNQIDRDTEFTIPLDFAEERRLTCLDSKELII